MSGKLKYFFLLPIFFLISACKEEAKSVEWFKNNPTELKSVLEKCKASGEDSDNCRNAKQAHYDITQKDAPVLSYH